MTRKSQRINQMRNTTAHPVTAILLIRSQHSRFYLDDTQVMLGYKISPATPPAPTVRQNTKQTRK